MSTFAKLCTHVSHVMSLLPDTVEPVLWDRESLTKNTEISSFAWHGLYKIMFLLPVVRDHLSWETIKFSGRFIQVSL